MQARLCKEHLDSLIEFRHKIHSLPELSGCEENTSGLIIERLIRLQNISVTENVGGYGIMAISDSGVDGKTVLFRADMDALPIQETNDFGYKSINCNVSHKCGHDGHLTVLVGLAEWLNNYPPKSGKVIMLFQPSEENGKGANNVLNDLKFSDIKPDFVFAFHNLPGFALNQIVIKDEVMTAAVSSVIFKFRGKTSHAAEPEKGRNPTYAIADLVQFVNKLNNSFPEKSDFFISTPIYTNIGEIAYGTSAGYGEIHYTFRAWNSKVLEMKVKEIVSEAQSLANSNRLKISTEVLDIFYNTVNNPEANDIIKQAAKLSKVKFTVVNSPFKWGEDFGLFTQNFKGALFCIGIGENSPALHSPDYDFPDEIISNGIGIFQNISLLINS